MTFEELAISLRAVEKVDGSEFRRRARVLQALWRREQGYNCRERRRKEKVTVAGSRLPMPWAKEKLANFMNDRVRSVVREEVLDRTRSRGKLYGKPRIFDDLLASQPLAFNLFAELRLDLPLASRLIEGLTKGRFQEVTSIAFEYSPARSSMRYTNDRSAFDVFLECTTRSGGRGFIGIEVKYHENLRDKPATHRARYDEIAQLMGCFAPDPDGRLRKAPLQQLWRDHLLAGIVRVADGYEDALFVVLAPKDNQHCDDAVKAYRAQLEDAGSFDTWILEDVVKSLARSSTNEWIGRFRDRYCAFERIERECGRRVATALE